MEDLFKENEEDTNDINHNDAELPNGKIISTDRVVASTHSSINPKPEEASELQSKSQTRSPISKSLHTLQVQTSSSSQGDGALIPAEPNASGSKAVVKRGVKELQVRVLRPILPRKSKDKAKRLMKLIAKGVVIAQGAVFQERARRPRRHVPVRKRFNKRNISRKSLFTVWTRPQQNR